MRTNVAYRDGDIKVFGRVKKPALYDNTRPDSLYNLKYATLR
jgi:hypothetical protein